MKYQWNLILAFIFALIVAIFAVINVDPVSVKYVFGEAEWPLILVILGSVLMGGFIVGFFGIVRIYILQRKIKSLTKENERLKTTSSKEEEQVIGEGKTEAPVALENENKQDTEQLQEDNQRDKENNK